MATTPITLNVDTTLLPTMINALCWSGGYQPIVPDANGNAVANPITKAQFAKQMIITYALNATQNYNMAQAAQAVTPPSTTLIT